MAGVSAVATRVSSNVLKMNFMKRTAMQIEEQEKAKQANAVKDERDDISARVYPTVQTIHDDPNCSIGSVFNEERMTVLEDLKFGRFSFNGQNPEIEKYMVYHECKRLGLELPEEEAEDEEADDEEDETMEDGEVQDTDTSDIKPNKSLWNTSAESEDCVITSTKSGRKHSLNSSFNNSSSDDVKPAKIGRGAEPKFESPNPLYVFTQKKNKKTGPHNNFNNQHNSSQKSNNRNSFGQNGKIGKKKRRR